MMPLQVFLGWDGAQTRAWNIARSSLMAHSLTPVEAHRVTMTALRGLYQRPTSMHDGRLWDDISDAPMSTGHAIARFFVPHLTARDGWALFTDGDVLFRKDVAELFALADSRFAIQVVQHQHEPIETTKMDGQVQTRYARKNWSSVMLWNLEHPAHDALTMSMLNTVPGRDLHRFCWLDDDLIGSLPAEWNWLVGHSSALIDPAIVHFTDGLPDQPGYESAPFADEWFDMARRTGYRLQPVKVNA